MITQFAGDEHEKWEMDTGKPTCSFFGSALQVWSCLQGRPTTVNEAALTFNVPPELIRQAVEDHSWMFLSGDEIEHDGE